MSIILGEAIILTEEEANQLYNMFCEFEKFYVQKNYKKTFQKYFYERFGSLYNVKDNLRKMYRYPLTRESEND